MPIRFATKSGSWSDTTVWDNGALPQAGDDVYANGFTVTIDQNVNVGSIRNTASTVQLPDTTIPVMSSNVSTTGLANANINSSSAWVVFDQTGSVTTVWNSGVNSNSGWISYQFFTSRIIKRYRVQNGNSGTSSPKTWTFQGSNDGTNWTILDTVPTWSPAAGGSYTSVVLANTNGYLYYRLNVTAINGGTTGFNISEFEMTESTGTVFGGTAGGSFTLNGGYTLTTTSGLIGSGGTTLLGYSAGAGNTSTINSTNTTLNTTYAISHTGAGTLNYFGNISWGPSGTGQWSINFSGSGVLGINGNLSLNCGNGVNSNSLVQVTSTGTLNLTGNVTGNSGAGQDDVGIKTSAASTINVIGNVNGGVGSGVNNHGITLLTTSGANVNITGTVTGGGVATSYGINIGILSNVTVTGSVAGSTGYGMYSTVGGNITVTGTVNSGTTTAILCTGANTMNLNGVITASTTSPAVYSSSTSATNTFTGPFVSNNNVMAVQVARLLLTTTPTYWRFQSDARTIYTADYNPDYPSTLNVRSGTSYGSGMTGTMVVPAASSVTSGVPVDNTVGTAANSATAVQDAVWGKLTSTMTTADSIGERVKNALTQDTLGNLLTNL